MLGRDAFQGGDSIAALGLLLHFVIALGWAVFFFVLSRKIPWLLRQPWLSGPLFGALVYLAMNRAIVPLSAAPFTLPMRWSGLAIHMFGVGLPIALAAWWFSAPRIRR